MKAGWVFLAHGQTKEGRTDSVRVDDKGRFTFSGKAGAPEYCVLGINGYTGTKNFTTRLFLESGTLTLSADKDSMEYAVVSGTPVQDEYRQYNAAERSAVDRDDKQGKQFARKYATDHPGSYIAVYELYTSLAYEPESGELEDAYKGLAASVQGSYFGQLLREALVAAQRTDVGQPAPDFTQNDIHGKPVTLSSLKGQYVLVDFWASWCGPCRAENPVVVKAYRQYHAKGFAILSVSLDDRKDKWEEAVKKDRLDWTHVSDLKGGYNSVAELYGVKVIPTNYLLDKEGRIIAKGLRGEQLEKKLAELVY